MCTVHVGVSATGGRGVIFNTVPNVICCIAVYISARMHQSHCESQSTAPPTPLSLSFWGPPPASMRRRAPSGGCVRHLHHTACFIAHLIGILCVVITGIGLLVAAFVL